MLENLSILCYYGTMTEKVPSKNAAGAGNEQGSPTDLAWLAGHMDGDGWIGIFKRMRSAEKRFYRYSASLAVMTTSDRNAERTRKVLDSLGVKYNDRTLTAYVGPDGSRRRAKWQIQMQSNLGVKVVLEAILPYLAEKRRCAEIVLEYIEWRESQPYLHGGRGKGSHVPNMDAKADEFIELLKNDRNRHDPSTTTRLAPSVTSRRRVMT